MVGAGVSDAVVDAVAVVVVVVAAFEAYELNWKCAIYN